MHVQIFCFANMVLLLFSRSRCRRRRRRRCLKEMLHETIRNDDFWRSTALQHCCDIVSNSYNIVPTLQHCVALKIVVANRPV